MIYLKLERNSIRFVFQVTRLIWVPMLSIMRAFYKTEEEEWCVALTFGFLFSFWVLLSGHFDPVHLFLGLVCSYGVAYLSHDLLFSKIGSKSFFKQTFQFLKYLPWFLYQVVLANLDVAYRTLHPKMPIQPTLVKAKTRLKTEMGKVTLANSITLTPGTVTIDVDEKGQFMIHAITEYDAKAFEEMEERIKLIEEE